ncbi:OLC1v1010554C1 [Oldenlandia corymbosa var. corymbosa]|uniref:OLC1v1010554C1 n=1 Tax=Oldenlandia corymbosa var. corymbosa TaxID=529605 RepID=A0AAV1DUU1_OLDCO|nr:OLC1v1010554C1 [Oldenlandia corymbosa var. corymbosa]
MFSLAACQKKSIISKLKCLLTYQNFNHTIVGDGLMAEHFADMGRGGIKFSKWRKLDSRELGIHQSMISHSAWTVIKILQNAGFEAYLVGGCVRDLVLNRIPKDFDVITTAALSQIKKQFHNCIIIGKRFPICHVKIKGCTVEVSSFDTVTELHEGREDFPVYRLPKGCNEKDLIRWKNCMHRDFTVNSLFYDPFTHKIYDYVNALSDLMSSKLRTLIPAQVSFEEDSARILRGLRLAARLNLTFSEETETAIHEQSPSILSLPKSRIMMELDYMLSYGAAAPSLSILHRFRLLEILLPIQAGYLIEQSRENSDQSTLMLMKLFSSLDQLCSCDRPAHHILWAAILAFHLGLVNDPEQALVVLTFGSVLYHGKWIRGVEFAREHVQEVHHYVPEISNSSDAISDDELAERVTELAVQVQNSISIFTETTSLLEEMEKYPELEKHGFVFMPKFTAVVAGIFKVFVTELTALDTNRRSLEIDYVGLKKGNLRELRFVLGTIILHTLGMRTVTQGGNQLLGDNKLDIYALGGRKRSHEFVETRHDVDEVKVDLLNNKLRKAYRRKESMIDKKQVFSRKSSNYIDRGKHKNHKAAADSCVGNEPEKKENAMKDGARLEVTRNHKEVISEGIGCVLQSYTNKMQISSDGLKEPRNEIQPLLETLKFQRVEQKSVNDKEGKDGAEKRLKLIEQVNNGISKKLQRSAKAKSCLQRKPDSAKAVKDHIKGDAKPENLKSGLARLSSMFR